MIFDFERKGYLAKSHLENNPSLPFYVYDNQTTESVYDDYYLHVWENQIDEFLSNKLKDSGFKVVSHVFRSGYVYRTYGALADNVPDYFSLTDLTEATTIGLQSEESFASETHEFERLLEVLSMIRNDISVKHLFIWFANSSFDIRGEELHTIESIDDVKESLK